MDRKGHRGDETRLLVDVRAGRGRLQGRGLDGVGFVFSASDPFTGVDLDNCRDPQTGQLEPWAAEAVAELGSYTEISPSATGVKVFVAAGMPPVARKKRGKVEFYSDRRFFTVTGQHLPGTPGDVEARPEELRRVHARLIGERRKAAGGGGQATGLSDEEILERARRGKAGSEFARLWEGDITGFDSQSEADVALCGRLAFWTGPDPGRITWLFGLSALGQRSKWSERLEYREATVRTAIEGQGKFYERPSGGAMLVRGDKTIQTIRTTQDQTRSMYTPTTPPGVPAKDLVELGSPSREDDTGSLLAEAGQGEGMQIAVELAKSRGRAPDWQAGFELARKLRTVSREDPVRFRPAVEAFCREAGRPFAEFWYVYLDCWAKVRVDEGEDAFSVAVRRAEEAPYEPTPCPGPEYARIASIAYHLGKLRHPEPFWLPLSRLSHVVGFSEMTISRILSLLARNGVIECVDPTYSFKDRKAKAYAFVGDRAGVDHAAAG